MTNSYDAVIEIPRGSRNKYEVDHETGRVYLDRVLFTSFVYPTDYGYFENTLADDGDPLDILVLTTEDIDPMVLVKCYPIGVIVMMDGGKRDEKIIAIPFDDPTYNAYGDISDLPAHIFDEMRHFFETYKELEGKSTAVDEVLGRGEAVAIIKESIDNYNEIFS